MATAIQMPSREDPLPWDQWFDYAAFTGADDNASQPPPQQQQQLQLQQLQQQLHQQRQQQEQAVPSQPNTTPTVPMIDNDEQLEAHIKPSHDYGMFKQQTGMPQSGLRSIMGHSIPQFSSTGLNYTGESIWDDAQFGDRNMLSANAGISDVDMNELSITSPDHQQPHDRFDAIVSPTPDQFVKVYPGYHTAEQQRQQQEQQQKSQIQQQQPRPQPAAAGQQRLPAFQFTPGQPVNGVESLEALSNEVISSVISKARQDSQSAALPVPQEMDTGMPHIGRLRRDPEEMDEDEKLLQSEAGKKLSAKERRQLRNKVSARAFRARRKDYISNLEDQIRDLQALYNQSQIQNRSLTVENAHLQRFIKVMVEQPEMKGVIQRMSLSPEMDKLDQSTSASVSQADIPTSNGALGQVSSGFMAQPSFSSESSFSFGSGVGVPAAGWMAPASNPQQATMGSETHLGGFNPLPGT